MITKNPEKIECTEYVSAHLRRSAEVKSRFADELSELVVEIAHSIAERMCNGGKLMLCGNGGSAADCQHVAAEFVSLLSQDFARPALPALALTTDSSFLTARANDFGFDEVFERQVEAFGMPKDALIGISTSGNSKNVLRAGRAAQERDILTIGLTGSAGGLMLKEFDHVLCVPSDSVQHIQECHIAVSHVLVELIEKFLFSDSNK